MTTISGPSAEEQVVFLGKIERLLSEGQFVATYKYALLVAIADLAIKLGSDEGSELDLPIRAIAEQFIELYWRQGAPYGNAVADGDYGTLQQNTGRQAAILSIVGNLRQSHGTLTRVTQSPEWNSTLTQTARLVTDMPLWRLQRLRSEVLEFLYTESPLAGNIRLKSGVAANLVDSTASSFGWPSPSGFISFRRCRATRDCWDPRLTLDNFSLVPTGPPYSVWPARSPMRKTDSACTAGDESTAEKSIISCPGHATRATLRIIWYSRIRSATAARVICWPPKCISTDGC